MLATLEPLFFTSMQHLSPLDFTMFSILSKAKIKEIDNLLILFNYTESCSLCLNLLG